MNRLRLLLPLLVLLLPTAAAQAASPVLLVGLEQGASASRVAQASNTAVVDRLETIDVALLRPRAGQSAANAMQALRRQGAVRYVEADRRVQMLGQPSDPLVGQLWGMRQIGAPDLWERGAVGEGQVVAVIDTGIDASHPDLASQLWTNSGETPNNGIDDDRNGVVDDVHGASFLAGQITGQPYDLHGHGTHVSGTIAGAANGVGVVGVAPGARIMAVRFLDANGSGSLADAVSAIDYAVDNGARILSNSWGCGGCVSQALSEAISRSERAGALFVAAAGNASRNNDSDQLRNYPSSYSNANIVAVGASDSADRPASFSNTGLTSVDLFAPGVNVLSSFPGGGYKNWNGTSMATPHVSGAIAVLWAVHPDATAQEVKRALLNGTDRPASLARLAVAGRLNVPASLGWNTSPTPPPPPPPPPPVLENLKPPVLSGQFQAGGKTATPVSCSTGTWTPRPNSTQVRWKVDGKLVAAWTGRGWITLGEGDIGKRVQCLVIAATTMARGEAVSEEVLITRVPLRQLSAGAILGSPLPGRWVTCGAANYNYAITQGQVRWYLNDREVRGSASSYLITRSDVGQQLRCVMPFTSRAGNGLSEPAPVTVRER